ncbi:MAG: dephospho-CoA kinase [Treponema sp.]|nr:dephospho-CoA kinase [Treponema sp.]
MIIGVTGLYCAGKNHVAQMLEKRGLPVLDLDQLGYEAIRTETAAIVRCFGKEVLGANGLVDRRLLGRQVFGRPRELAALEAIIHPVVNCLTGEWIDRQTVPCVINAALLHKSSGFARLDAVIVVKAPFLVRFFRAEKRDKLPPGEVFKRLQSQNNFPQYKTGTGKAQLFSCSADIYTIQNSGFSGSQRILDRRMDAILERLRCEDSLPSSTRKLF